MERGADQYVDRNPDRLLAGSRPQVDPLVGLGPTTVAYGHQLSALGPHGQTDGAMPAYFE
jgi:hypothetical protein